MLVEKVCCGFVCLWRGELLVQVKVMVRRETFSSLIPKFNCPKGRVLFEREGEKRLHLLFRWQGYEWRRRRTSEEKKHLP